MITSILLVSGLILFLNIWLLFSLDLCVCSRRYRFMSVNREPQPSTPSVRENVFLSPVHTVAEKCDCRRKRRDNGDSRRIRRQSHFSATVWTGLYEWSMAGASIPIPSGRSLRPVKK